MLKQSMLSLLLLTSLTSSAHAESFSFVWQSEESSQEAEQQDNNFKLDDACIAAAAGFCGAYMAEIFTQKILNKFIADTGYDFMPVLITAALYGSISKKISQADNQKLRMFGWGGLVGSSLIAIQACQARLKNRSFWCR